MDYGVAAMKDFRTLTVVFTLLMSVVLGEGAGQFKLSSPDFAYGEPLPAAYAYCGPGARNLSPPLVWSGAPAETASFVLLVHDPDAPVGDFVHWVVYDIPASQNSLPRGASGRGSFLEGRNDYGFSGYGGPCPPPGPPHRYFFELYALSSAGLSLPPGATAAEVQEAIRPYVLARAELMGTYKR